MRTPIPITNPILIVDASSAPAGFKMVNTGAVQIFLSQNKAKLAASINPNSGLPSEGWPLNPNDRLEYVRAIGSWYAVAAAQGGEIELDIFPVDLPCCP